MRQRPKPWFFAADETMTFFCTEGRAGNASAPHDHGAWSVLGCFDGSEESWWHEATPDGLRQVGSGVLRPGEVHALPADAIHAVLNRWNQPNGVVHIYEGNFLAAERSIWDPVTHERHTAPLDEPLAPASRSERSDSRSDGSQPQQETDRPTLGGTAFAAVSVSDINGTARFLADALGLTHLTDHEDSCAVDEQYTYLIEPASLTIVGLHRSTHSSTHSSTRSSTRAGLEHVALRVPSLAQLDRWHQTLQDRGFQPSGPTAWKFGTFVDVTGPEELTIRLFVPSLR
jgi:catechol 2,3-dioxygenase-like lactoylglutathione lyase family enzyme